MLLVCEMADTSRFTGRGVTFPLILKLDQGCGFSPLEKVTHAAAVRMCSQVSNINPRA